MINLYHAFKVKHTPCREAIFLLLQKTKKPLSAEDVHKQLRGQFDLVTIYRNLYLFEEKGMVFREKIGRGDYFYLAEAPHHHAVCTNCGKTECFPCDHRLPRLKHFKILNHQLTLNGLCAACSKYV